MPGMDKRKRNKGFVHPNPTTTLRRPQGKPNQAQASSSLSVIPPNSTQSTGNGSRLAYSTPWKRSRGAGQQHTDWRDAGFFLNLTALTLSCVHSEGQNCRVAVSTCACCAPTGSLLGDPQPARGASQITVRNKSLHQLASSCMCILSWPLRVS